VDDRVVWCANADCEMYHKVRAVCLMEKMNAKQAALESRAERPES